MRNFGFPEDVLFIPIFHLGRSGSTHLERSLATSFAALSLGEIFNNGVSTPFLAAGHDWQAFFDDDLKSFLAFCVLRGFERIYWESRKKNEAAPRRQVVFFEYKPTLVQHAFHGIHSTFLLRMRELGITRAIVLERRSVVRRLVSSQSAQKSGIYHSDQVASPERAEPQRIHLDVEHILDDGINPGFPVALRDAQDLNDVYFAKLRLELRATGFEILNLEYEKDICGPIDDVISAVSSFIGKPATGSPSSGLIKFLPNDLSKILSNSEEVIAYCERNHLRL